MPKKKQDRVSLPPTGMILDPDLRRVFDGFKEAILALAGRNELTEGDVKRLIDRKVRQYDEIRREHDESRVTEIVAADRYLDVRTSGMGRRQVRVNLEPLQEEIVAPALVRAMNSVAVQLQWVPVKLTARTNYNTYTGDVYGDGSQNTATATSQTIRIAAINTSAVLPTTGDRSFYLARLEDWSGTVYWTAYPPLIA